MGSDRGEGDGAPVGGGDGASGPDRSPTSGLIARSPGAALVAAAIFWACAGLIGRSSPMKGPVLAFWRALLGTLMYQAAMWRSGRRLRMADLRTAAFGGLGFGLSIACLFVAYQTTTLISANVIAALQPLALGVFDHRRGRHLGPVLWAATGAAVAGTAIVVVGSSAHTGTWSLRGDLFALAGTVANVGYVLGTKRARRTMGPLDYQASMLLVAAAVTLPVALVVSAGHAVPPARGWWWVLGLATIGGTGHLLFSAAQRHVSVAASSAIVLVEVLAVAVGAAIVYHQSIRWLQAVGMVVVAAAIGVWLSRSPDQETAALPGSEVG